MRCYAFDDGSYGQFDKMIEKINDGGMQLIARQGGSISDLTKFGNKSIIGKFIMFVDADDYLDGDYIEKCIIV